MHEHYKHGAPALANHESVGRGILAVDPLGYMRPFICYRSDPVPIRKFAFILGYLALYPCLFLRISSREERIAARNAGTVCGLHLPTRHGQSGVCLWKNW